MARTQPAYSFTKRGDLARYATVADALPFLRKSQREALEALKLRQLSLAQASAVSGQSVAALKVNTHRALKALRALFQKES